MKKRRRDADQLPAGEEELQRAGQRHQLRAGGEHAQQREEADEARLLVQVGAREARDERRQQRAAEQRDGHRDAVHEQHGRNHEVADAQPVTELDVAAHRCAEGAQRSRRARPGWPARRPTRPAPTLATRSTRRDAVRRAATSSPTIATLTSGARMVNDERGAHQRRSRERRLRHGSRAAWCPGPTDDFRQRAAHERRRHVIARPHVPLGGALDDRQQRRHAARTGTNAPPSNTAMAPVSGCADTSCTHALTTSSATSGCRPATASSASGVASTMRSRRIGSWSSTICSGSPVRRSLWCPFITPMSPVTLCGSLVPQPNVSLSTDEK